MRVMRHLRHRRLRIAIALAVVMGAIAVPLAVIGFASAGDDNSLTAVAK